MKHLKTYEKLTAYYDVYLTNSDFNMNVSEEELNVLIENGFDIFWGHGLGGYRFAKSSEKEEMELLKFLKEYREAKKHGVDFNNIKKYNL